MSRLLTVLFALVLLHSTAAAQTAEDPVATGNTGTSAAPTEAVRPSAQQPAGSGETVSLAERIARLQRAVEADQEHLRTLQTKLCEQEKEFEEAGEEFKQIDAQLEEKRKALEAARSSGTEEEVEQFTDAVAGLEKKWKLTRERFDLAISARKTAQEQIVGLETKIAQDSQALEKLMKPAEAVKTPSAPPQPAPPTPPAAPAEPPAEPVKTSMGLALPGAATVPAAAGEAQPAPPSAPEPKAPPKEVLQAQTKAAEAEASAREAEHEVDQISQRVDMLDTNIRLEQQARDAARKQADNAEETLRQLGDELQTALDEGAAPAVVQAIRRKMADAQTRLRAARAEVAQRTGQLDKLQAERGTLLSEQLLAAHKLERERKKAEAAHRSLQAIQNPLAPENVLRWLAEKGPKLLTILVAALALHVLIRVVASRIVAFLTRNESNGKRTERENRANTLVGVFHNTGIIVLYVGAALTVLDVAGIPIAPLLGGAAVVGLAVAFAAQNLIKDYFYGFMILLEDQYGVNDVVTIGGITGFVERITLRITVLRNFDAAHFIPHGQITTVSNLTHKWSRAVFDIGVSYHEDVDRVMEVLMDLGRQMRLDPEFRSLILEDPEMLGVDAFADSAVIIKFFMKTRPMQQWTVKREMLRRIKNKFDELGIEIPFPHRTVYHRYEEGALKTIG